MTRRGRRRPGMTLMEVIVSTTIFLVAAMAIYYISSLGAERALDIYDQTKASMLCQSKLAEIIAGAETSGGGGGYSAFPDEKDYEWRMEAGESDIPGLLDVQVWVRRERPGGVYVEVHLAQKVLNPAQRGSTFDQPNVGTNSTDAGGTTTGGM